MTIALTGASGFIGARLVRRLQADGHTVRALGRSDPRIPGVQFAQWDAVHHEPAAAALADAEAVIHLAGEPVAQRWSAEVKRGIRESRVAGTRNLVAALAKLPTEPRVLISASAIGYYGNRGEEILPETAPPAKDFLAEVCVEWEREAREAAALGIRTAMTRIGIVLGKEGGALKQMLPPFRAGLGGPLGSGRQWVSWIHVDDLVDLIVFALDSNLEGPINATSPIPVRNADFAKALAGAIGRPSVVPTPAFVVKMMFGEMANMVLASQRVVPEAATRAGFQFRHPEVRGALEDVLTSR
jgi:uncharacterized protein (TIGR01777 family)